MKPYFILTALLLFVISCDKKSNSNDPITQPEDYNTYLTADTTATLDKALEELNFWNKRIKVDSSQLIDLSKSAGVQTRIFQTNADIRELKNAERNLEKTVEKAAIGKKGYLLALAQNYVTQHRFREAQEQVDLARTLGGPEDKDVNFVQFDVAMELGNYDLAEQMLEKEADFSNYNYLIRLAKWEDYSGNLDKTIQQMEHAKIIAEGTKQKGLMLWVYTNIADYYGHDGRIKDAYNHYLKALELDPTNAYAKKGIAWITYAHENNPEEALRIISSIENGTNSPDYALLKAEIFEHMGDTAQAERLTQEFIEKASNPIYGEMYNTYLLEIYAGDIKTASKALEIAEREVKNRPTPETYDLLAYAYLKNNKPKEALEIQKKHVIGKTFEPVAQLHTAQIYKALGMTNEVEPLKDELLDARFELGPVTTQNVKNL